MKKDELKEILMDLKQGQDELFKGQEKLFKGQDELFKGQEAIIEEQKEMKEDLKKLSQTVAKIEVEHGQKLEILLDVVAGHTDKLNEEKQKIEKCEERLDKHDNQIFYLNSRVKAY